MGVVVSRLVGRDGFETRPYAVPAHRRFESGAGSGPLLRGRPMQNARCRRPIVHSQGLVHPLRAALRSLASPSRGEGEGGCGRDGVKRRALLILGSHVRGNDGVLQWSRIGLDRRCQLLLDQRIAYVIPNIRAGGSLNGGSPNSLDVIGTVAEAAGRDAGDFL